MGAAKAWCGSESLSGSRQTSDEVDHRRIDLGRLLSLGDMPAAGSMIVPRSCGTNFAKSAKCARPCRGIL